MTYYVARPVFSITKHKLKRLCQREANTRFKNILFLFLSSVIFDFFFFFVFKWVNKN